jgi:hypothetical protein
MKLALGAVVVANVGATREEKCCVGACKTGEKYYSVAESILGTKHCGECCMDPKDYKLYHLFEKNLTKADNESPCAITFGYTKYDSTVTHGFGPVKMTLDLYDLPTEPIKEPVIAVAVGNLTDSTCAKPGDCGRAYQTCCAGFAAKGYPCGCHLKDGTGQTGADCGTCGSAYSVCCAGFKAKGFPCTCDISSGGDSTVV